MATLQALLLQFLRAMLPLLLTSLKQLLEARMLRRRAAEADKAETERDLERRARDAEGRANEIAINDPGADDLLERLRNEGL